MSRGRVKTTNYKLFFQLIGAHFNYFDVVISQFSCFGEYISEPTYQCLNYFLFFLLTLFRDKIQSNSNSYGHRDSIKKIAITLHTDFCYCDYYENWNGLSIIFYLHINKIIGKKGLNFKKAAWKSSFWSNKWGRYGHLGMIGTKKGC